MSDRPPPDLAIGALADAVGTTVRTIRHYESVGLVEPADRTAAGHRRYGDADVERLRRILELRQLGFGVVDIRDLLGRPAYDTAEALHALAARHLADLDRELAVQAAVRDQLAALVNAPTATTTQEVTAMSIELDEIITRKGDRGRTRLVSGPSVPKSDPRIEALGAVDELNVQLGLAQAQPDVPPADRRVLDRVQQQLFDLGADLATDAPASSLRLDAGVVAWLDSIAPPLAEDLEPLTSFVLPGGTPYSAQLHACRSACRTAERRVVDVRGTGLDAGDQPDPLVQYLNRLSDVLFLLARRAQTGVEVTWTPSKPDDQAPS